MSLLLKELVAISCKSARQLVAGATHWQDPTAAPAAVAEAVTAACSATAHAMSCTCCSRDQHSFDGVGAAAVLAAFLAPRPHCCSICDACSDRRGSPSYNKVTLLY
jgi:urea transporter